jgi:hypothetical protein
MRPLNSRLRGRFTPKVEALEDRTFLNATLAGGTITTTAAVNHVLITDNGTAITVFSDNGLLGPALPEGTALTVKTSKKGSTNFVEYDLLGSTLPNEPAVAVTIVSSLTVNFGTGNGSLLAQVLVTLPVVFGGPHGNTSNLGQNSNVKIAATSSKGNTQDNLYCASIGTGASLSDVDTGGKGNNTFNAGLTGTEFSGASVNLKYTGGDGNNTAGVGDMQDINGGASTVIDLRVPRPPGDSDDHNGLGMLYTGQLQGSLNVTVDAGAGSNNILLGFGLAAGSTLGSLTSSAKTGPGVAKVLDVVEKDAADSPSVTETATGVGSGAKAGFFTVGTSTSVAVIFSGFSPVTILP